MKQNEVITMFESIVRGKYPCKSGVIAQLILEVGFDLKTPKDIATGRESYNLGNIKGVGPAGSVTINTKEHYTAAQIDAARRAGTLVRIIERDPRDPSKTIVVVRDQFRAYRSYAEALDDHLQLLKKPRYVRAGLWEAKTPKAFAEALKVAGYATDTAYVDKIMSIVWKYELTKYDKEDEYMLKVEDANKIISTFIQPAWGVAKTKAEKDELHRLANEVRKASGQKV